ncbi:MAG: cytochrome P450 [Rickettsiales bacterium]|nr:cytochrome P450 [Rickettsiales bacterium]
MSSSLSAPSAPGPRGTWLLGMLPEFRADPIQLFSDLTRDYGDTVSFSLFNRPCMLLRHPDQIAWVLKKNHRNYGKNTRGIQKLKAILGDGLLTADGPHWRRQRRIAAPTFRPKRIGGFAATMLRAGEDMLCRWEELASREQAFDVNEEMMTVTLRIAGETLFSADVTGEARELSQALSTAMQITNKRVGRALDMPSWWPSAENRAFRAAMAALDEIVRGMIEERRRTGEAEADLLAMLIHARDEETGEGMSDAQLRDEVMTLLLAGHETTANALTWTWHLLAANPDCRAQLEAELDRVLDGRSPTLEDYSALEYTGRVIDEAMRLLPPGWLFGRAPLADDVIDGFAVPAGTLVMISSYITHRHSEFWPDPERFDPDRFLPAACEERHPFAYFPFSGGPRGCIGRGFALLELRLLVAQIAQRFRLEAVPGHPVELEQLVTLRPLHGLQMTAYAR